MSGGFAVGQKVTVHGRRGVVTSVTVGRVHVFLEDGSERIYEPGEVSGAGLPRAAEHADLMRHLLALKFDRPISDNLYSISASRTKFQVYQFKPAVKFFDTPHRRLLIADEVGLGKTIEAGIIMAELNARSALPLERALIVCPSGLKEKWHDEMLRRFGEEFTIASVKELRTALENFANGTRQRFRLICGLEVIRAEPMQDLLLKVIAENGLTLDFTVIDEAHHLRNTPTLSHKVGKILSIHSAAFLLLTATPVQLGGSDLYHLLSLLDEDAFPSMYSGIIAVTVLGVVLASLLLVAERVLVPWRRG